MIILGKNYTVTVEGNVVHLGIDETLINWVSIFTTAKYYQISGNRLTVSSVPTGNDVQYITTRNRNYAVYYKDKPDIIF